MKCVQRRTGEYPSCRNFRRLICSTDFVGKTWIISAEMAQANRPRMAKRDLHIRAIPTLAARCAGPVYLLAGLVLLTLVSAELPSGMPTYAGLAQAVSCVTYLGCFNVVGSDLQVGHDPHV